jgi:hypothetical protein
MPRPRKIDLDDRYNEHALNGDAVFPVATYDYDSEGSLPELGQISSRGAFAALRDEDFGDNRS